MADKRSSGDETVTWVYGGVFGVMAAGILYLIAAGLHEIKWSVYFGLSARRWWRSRVFEAGLAALWTLIVGIAWWVTRDAPGTALFAVALGLFYYFARPA